MVQFYYKKAKWPGTCSPKNEQQAMAGQYHKRKDRVVLLVQKMDRHERFVGMTFKKMRYINVF
jgi:hypothetical protein